MVQRVKPTSGRSLTTACQRHRSCEKSVKSWHPPEFQAKRRHGWVPKWISSPTSGSQPQHTAYCMARVIMFPNKDDQCLPGTKINLSVKTLESSGVKIAVPSPRPLPVPICQQVTGRDDKSFSIKRKERDRSSAAACLQFPFPRRERYKPPKHCGGKSRAALRLPTQRL